MKRCIVRLRELGRSDPGLDGGGSAEAMAAKQDGGGKKEGDHLEVSANRVLWYVDGSYVVCGSR